MNKSAAKEPSMDEILSSIRQIIADDDAAEPAPDLAAPAEELVVPAEANDSLPEDSAPLDFDIPEEFNTDDVAEIAEVVSEDAEALELSAEQIVPLEDDVPAAEEPDVEALMLDEPMAVAEEEPAMPELVVPDDISFDTETELDAAPEPELSDVGSPEPLPDPDLTADLAEKLLEPATDVAVKGAFAKLGNVALGAQNLTIENMIREMLRPMLKEWLDENLPGVVEKMVEKEIERLARGG